MKRVIHALLALALLGGIICLFSACHTFSFWDESVNTESEQSVESVDTVTTEHRHTWSSWRVTKNATCLEKGQKKRVCDCGEIETQEISLANHRYVDQVCLTCKQTKESAGLSFELNKDKSSYTVTGMGDCEDVGHLVIPSTYKSLPAGWF